MYKVDSLLMTKGVKMSGFSPDLNIKCFFHCQIVPFGQREACCFVLRHTEVVTWSPVCYIVALLISDLVSLCFSLYFYLLTFHSISPTASRDIRCLVTNILTKEKPLTWISSPIIHTHNGSHWIQYKIEAFKLIQNSVEVDQSVTLRESVVCVHVCVRLCRPELSAVAQSSVGFVEFPGVAGFAVLLRASLPKVLSLNCERICC